MMNQLIEKLKCKEQRMIEIRRYLHQYPELSFQEKETPKYIADFYKDKDCKVETNVGPNGVKVTIDSGNPGKTLAIRADFDALPIEEETGLDFSSKHKGVMHACGHDAHTAYMLILAETLIELKNQFNGKVIVIHQPAEEVPPGGAQGMIKDGVLDGVDHVLGLHVMSNMTVGNIYYREGNVQTGRDFFKLKVIGQGGHGSSPHAANDTIVAGAHFVTALQTIVSRRLNPFETGVVTIGSFDGKGQFNIIKDSIEIEGDVRALTDETKHTIKKEVQRLSKGLEAMFGVTCELDYQDDYPALYNDPQLTRFVVESLKNTKTDALQNVEVCEAQPPSEDFAYYAKAIPSSFIYAGAAPENGDIYPHHHPKFNISEKSLRVAAEAVGISVLNYLK
ncbi:amidohydrolase [Staphylococcus succinus]|jgi:amidohydrolase|uniref:M20 family metallopeptidase n=1 Tax=Staphylococcus succinus TaxID=61015 RepID=UPI0009373470|nr:M20 family metallopeptidase [Staphylococcus succinus]MEB8127321.1 M20 family metallopeptidase [Staphylococcus succinus]MEB8210161.1 M20 family metallopeptidase [Staphylococcus succinus]PTI43091.1 amidohydrolase [Staphylococcus succinus]PTJ20343.1 amidohydrolase [Staphylococcus succinus]RIN32570.1 amidohydrolase [Staphylococcus succinus]